MLASGTEITSRVRMRGLRLLGRYGLRGVAPMAHAID